MKKKQITSLITSGLVAATVLISLSPSVKSGNKAHRSSEDIDYASCSYKGFKLYGKIQVVDAFPDVKVQVVDAFPDLKVMEVDAFPDDCGKWQFVDAFPDTKIQFVDAFPDVTIQYVDAFPGKP